jgi:hypothetical protein
MHCPWFHHMDYFHFNWNGKNMVCGKTEGTKDFAYCVSFVAGLSVIFPIISPWMMYAPSLALCYFQGDSYWKWYAVALYIGDVSDWEHMGNKRICSGWLEI